MEAQALHFNQEVEIVASRKRGAENKLDMKGRYQAEHWRDGVLLGVYDIDNDITNEGKNTIFDVMFNSATQITTWYIGLINNSGFSALAASDVMNSHAGWTEFTTYSQANRVTWGSGAAASQTVTNASPATFDITGSGTLNGIFITSNNTKSGTTGKLWSTASFSATVPVVNGDQIKITYTLNA